MGLRGPHAQPKKKAEAWSIGEIEKPDNLGELASLEFDRLVNLFTDHGIACPAFTDDIIRMSILHQRFSELNQMIDDEGLVIESSQGKKKHPAYSAMLDAGKELRQLRTQYFLTPATAHKLSELKWTPEGEEEEDPLAEFKANYQDPARHLRINQG